jgi:hypothetical protein
MNIPMPLDLSSFLDTMFTNQRVNMLGPVTDEAELPPYSFTLFEDGVWILMKQGECLGWVSRVTGEHKFRALSNVTNNVERFYSLDTAREFLFSQAH